MENSHEETEIEFEDKFIIYLDIFFSLHQSSGVNAHHI